MVLPKQLFSKFTHKEKRGWRRTMRDAMLIRWLNWLITKWWSVMMPLGDTHTRANTCTRRHSCLGSLLCYDEARSHARANARPHNISALAHICSAPWQLDISMFVYLCVCRFETPATQVSWGFFSPCVYIFFSAFCFQSLIIALFKSHIKTVGPDMTYCHIFEFTKT